MDLTSYAELAVRLVNTAIRAGDEPDLLGDPEAFRGFVADRPHLADLHLSETGSVADRYAAGAVIGLAMLVAQFGVNRLGVCTIASCHGVFIDASPNRSRRYCADHCTTRTNVTAIGTQRRTGNTSPAATAAS